MDFNCANVKVTLNNLDFDIGLNLPLVVCFVFPNTAANILNLEKGSHSIAT